MVVGDAQVDDAVCVLHVDRPDFGGLVHAETTALDHRGAAHADARILARDHDVAAAEQRRVAREAVTRGDPDERHEAAQAREQRERAAVQAGDDRHVDVARAPAAALGEQHHRKPAPLGDLEQPVLLHVVAHALRAREHGVVVGHRNARAAVDLADARDEPVGGRALDQLLARPSRLLRGEQQRSVLDVGALVEQLGEVLACRTPTALAPACDGFRPGRVESDGVPRAHVLEVAAKSARGGAGRLCGLGRGAGARREDEQQLALLDRVADRDRHALHDAGRLGEHLVLHLHRLEHEQRRAGCHLFRGAAGDRHDDARERSCDGELGGGHREIIAQER